MTDLEELIQNWQNDLAINFIHRTPQANNRIELTIKYLTQLSDYYKQGHQPYLSAPGRLFH